MSAERIAAAALAGLHSMGSDDLSRVLDREVEERRQDPSRKEEAVGNPTDATCDPVALPSTRIDASKSQGIKQNGSKIQASRKSKQEVKLPAGQVIIQVKRPRTYVNHSYKDYSKHPPELDETLPSLIQDMTFPMKVHHILSQKEYSRFISWQPHGRAFRVTIPKMFEKQVCAKYFGHTRYSSFLRQLSNHSFKHITHGADRNCYYHEFMLRGLPHLVKYMPRPKDARRLIPDPANEPDFHAISQAYPLPEEAAQQRLVEGGMPRLASEIPAFTGSVPPQKRARTGSAEHPKTVQPNAQAASNAAPELLAKLVAASLGVQQLGAPVNPVNQATAPNHAVSCSNSIVAPILTAQSAPILPAPPLQPSPTVVNNDALSLGNAWAALRSPQFQTSMNRNTGILEAMRAGMVNPVANVTPPPTPQPPQTGVPVLNNNAAAIIAAALLQNCGSNTANSAGSLLASLGGLLGGQL